MPSRMEVLLAAQERAQQQKHEAARKERQAKKQISDLQRKTRNHRLITRGAYLEKLLQKPELLTDEEVFAYLDYAINTPYARKRLESLLESKARQEPETRESQAYGGINAPPVSE